MGTAATSARREHRVETGQQRRSSQPHRRDGDRAVERGGAGNGDPVGRPGSDRQIQDRTRNQGQTPTQFTNPAHRGAGPDADGGGAQGAVHQQGDVAHGRRAAIGVCAGKHQFARAVEQEAGIGVGKIVFDHPAQIQRVARTGGEGGGYAPRVHQHDIGRERIDHRAGAGQQPALKPEAGIIRRGHAAAKGAAGKIDGADIAGAVLGVPPRHTQRAAVIDIDRISEIRGEDGTVIPLKGERGPAVDRGGAVQYPIGKSTGVKHQSSAIEGRAARVGICAGEGEAARAGFDQRIGAADYRADNDVVADFKRGAGRTEIDLPAGQGVARRAHRETGYSRPARDGDRADAGRAKGGGARAGPGDVAAARGPVGRGGVPKEITGAIRPCEWGGNRHQDRGNAKEGERRQCDRNKVFFHGSSLRGECCWTPVQARLKVHGGEPKK